MLSRMSLDHTPFCLKNQDADPIEMGLLSHQAARIPSKTAQLDSASWSLRPRRPGVSGGHLGARRPGFNRGGDSL
jgi:hypothetical protein